MAVKKCPNCGEKLETESDFCPYCGASTNPDNTLENKEITKVVNWFLQRAQSISTLSLTFGILMMVVGIMALGSDNPTEGVITLVSAFLFIGWGIIYAKEAEWKAYVLKSLNDINKKTK